MQATLEQPWIQLYELRPCCTLDHPRSRSLARLEELRESSLPSRDEGLVLLEHLHDGVDTLTVVCENDDAARLPIV